MPKFDQALNLDVNDKLTSAYYDANVAAWIQKTQMHVLSSGGILVPASLDAGGNFKTSVKDSALPLGAATEAKQTALNNLLGAIDAVAVTDPTVAGTIIALLKGLLKQHQGSGSVKDQTDVIDRAARELGKITAEDAAIATLGAIANAAVTDPEANGTAIALLKGIIKQLQLGIPLSGSNATEGTGAKMVSRTGDLALGTIETVLDVSKSIEIIAFEFSSNNESVVRLYIEPKDSSGNYATGSGVLLTNNAAAMESFRFNNLKTHKSALLEVVVDAAGTYKAINRAGITIPFPNGGRIRVQNSSSSSVYTAGIYLFYREVV